MIAGNGRCGKVQYKTRDRAVTAMRHRYVLDRRAKKRRRGKMGTYQCPACGMWHYGHQRG